MSDTITITGNIATAPELTRMSDGGAITKFRLASGHRRFDKATNSWVDGETNWYSVSIFRTLGEHAFESLHKGERILVTGRLRLREWETAAKKGWTAEIDADAIGHDLLFGTTRFEKAARGSAEPPSTDASWPLTAAGEASWANPAVAIGTPENPDPASADPIAEVEQRQLASVAGETPF